MDLKRINTNRRRLRDTFTRDVHEGLRGKVFIKEIIPKYGAAKRIHNTLAAIYARALNAIKIFTGQSVRFILEYSISN